MAMRECMNERIDGLGHVCSLAYTSWRPPGAEQLSLR